MKRLITVIACVALGATALSAQTPSAPRRTAAAAATLSVEAGVLMQSGDVKRAARSPIILLGAGFPKKLLEVNPHVKGIPFDELLRLHVSVKRVPAPQLPGELGARAREIDKATDAVIAAHTVATAVTDFDGKTTLQAPPGNYFVHGSFEAGKSLVVWCVPINLKPGKNTLVLDHANAVPQ